MQSGKASDEHDAAGGAPAAESAGGRLHDADTRALLEFFDRERRRTQRSALTAGAAGAVVGALAILAANSAGWLRLPAAAAGGDGLGRRISELESSSGNLSAQVRALVSQPRGPVPGAGEVAAAPPRKERSDPSNAGK